MTALTVSAMMLAALLSAEGTGGQAASGTSVAPSPLRGEGGGEGQAISYAKASPSSQPSPSKGEGVDLADGKMIVDLPGAEIGVPYWSPDDEWLAFRVTRFGEVAKPDDPKQKPVRPPRLYDVYVCRPDGSDLKRLHEAPAAGLTVIGPDWVGRHVLFGLRTRDGTMFRIVDLDGKQVYRGEFGPYRVMSEDTLLVSCDDGVRRVGLPAGTDAVVSPAPPQGEVFTDLAAPADLSYVVARLGDNTHLLFPDRKAVIIEDLVLAEPSPDGAYVVGHVPVISPTKIRVTVGAVLYKVDVAGRKVSKVRDLLSPKEYLAGWRTMRPWWIDSTRVEFAATPIASEGRALRHWYLHHVDVPDGTPRRVKDIEAFSRKTEASRDRRWSIIWRKFINRGEWLVIRGQASYRKTDRYLMRANNDISHDGTRLAGKIRGERGLWVFALKRGRRS